MLLSGFSRIISSFLILQISISTTLAFNVDTENSVAYSGLPGTFFGYSVAMAQNDLGKSPPTILIGAPKGNYDNTKFKRTGVVYRCTPTAGSCVFSRVEDLDNNLPDLTVQIVNDAWIGGNIAVNRDNTQLLTCGHRWKEWTKSDGQNIKVSMRGICYLGKLADDSYQLVRSKLTGSHSSMGRDAVFSKDGSEIIVGVPGYEELSGAIVTFDTTDVRSEKLYHEVKKSNSYAGSSVSSGTFYSDKLEYYVMGAPRYNNTGAVYIVNRESQAIRQELFHTKKLGAYFGASLCVTDLNGDGYDDLLVGAPLYSKNILEGGAVMLYLSDGQSLTYSRTLWGMEMERGQFGTAIEDVGDINNDGFNDIVIGAPYEKQQEGAIYIYNLGREGFPANFSQRISGLSVGQGKEMKGFGISISQAVDMNDDSYPDFLVGSYLSDQVRLLKSRPVLALDIKGVATPERIDVNTYNCPSPISKSVCMNLKLTLSYKTDYAYLPDNIELDCKLYTEVSSLANNASSSVHRALVKSGSQYEEFKDFPLSLSNTKAAVLNFNLLIKDKSDIFSPIGVFLDYKLRDGSLTSCPKLCPVLKGSPYKMPIHYNLDCGADEKCSSDLHLSMTTDREHILFGKNPNFRLHVSVFNRGESAYNSLALFNFPNFVQYVQVTNTDVAECSSDTSGEAELVRCSLGNHIPKDYNVTFTLVFANAGSLKENEINIHASVKTKSDEQNLADNEADVKIPVRMQADITFNGFSDPNLLHYSKKTSELRHNFDIYNNGPSPLLNARIRIIVPELREFVSINCAKSTLKNCSTEFYLDNLNYGERKLINVVLDVNPEIFKKAEDIKSLKSTAVLTRQHNPLYLDDTSDWSYTATILTNLQTETKPVSSWIIIISILAGLIVLALLILILWKVGFFKRKKAGDLDPLTEEGKAVGPQDDADDDADEKDTLKESNGNTSPPPVKDEEKVALSQQADVQDVEV